MILPSFCQFFFVLPVVYRRACKKKRQCFAALLTVCIALAANACLAGTFYSLDELRQLTANYLTKQYAKQDESQITVTIGALNSRLHLSRCAKPLELSSRDPAGTGGNLSVLIQCNDQKPWSIYAPARVSIYRKIPVATQDLKRGHKLSNTDFGWETRDISQLRQEVIADPASLVGLELRRNLGRGQAFLSSSAIAPKVIKRGDQIALRSSIAGIEVITSGTAMSDGRVGQKMRIKNNQSGRIVSGTVVAAGKVTAL